MGRVLIVDDEPGYLDLIGQVLFADGHEIRRAASGRDALDVGTRYRPDVVVADWMLKDDIHGLHVINALRAVLPEVRAIVMTGFPSADLREGAGKAGVVAFLEKPFDACQIRISVRNALAAKNSDVPVHSLAMIETDSDGSIIFANSAAKGMMEEVEAGQEASSMATLLAEEVEPTFQAAARRWVAVLPRRAGHKRWHLRSQEPHSDGSRLTILRRCDEPHFLGLALVEMLLGVKEVDRTRWPLPGRVLVLDDELLYRSLHVSMLESAGAGCYAAANLVEALPLLEKDDKVNYVLLDDDMPDCDTRSAVEQIRALRSNVTIVGNGAGSSRDRFVLLGVKNYLEKPWRIDDLINILTGRIGKCASCGIPIPLRRPRLGEEAMSWECCSCGARYRAIMDEGCPANTLSNVRHIHRG